MELGADSDSSSHCNGLALGLVSRTVHGLEQNCDFIQRELFLGATQTTGIEKSIGDLSVCHFVVPDHFNRFVLDANQAHFEQRSGIQTRRFALFNDQCLGKQRAIRPV